MVDSGNSHPVCLVTGGSSGIGLATVKRFVGEGYHVAFCGRDADKLNDVGSALRDESAKRKCRLMAFQADLNEPEQAKGFANKVLEQLGRIDVLVNNASVAPLSNFEEISSETFETSINVSIRSLFYLTQIVWRNMKTQGAGTIVNISSLAAVDPFPGFSLYGACKAWMDLMTHSLAGEGKDCGVRVCSIRPGAVETPMLRGLFPDFPAEDCVQPSDIADVVWGCVNQPEDYPSGQAFVISAPSADG